MKGKMKREIINWRNQRIIILLLGSTIIFAFFVIHSSNTKIKDKIYQYAIKDTISEKSVCEITEKTLKESESNWEQYIVKRDDIMTKFGFNYDKDPWDWTDGRTFWDFWQPYYNCPHSEERIGRVGDGGKWICGVNHLAVKPTPCIIYSYGISGDYSFDENILERTNCLVYMYDPSITSTTVKPVLDKFPGRAFFKPIGLWNTNAKPSYHTLRKEMEENGHSFIDILKVDIEGAEFLAFRQIFDDFPGELPFGQLQLEIHIFDDIYTEKNFYSSVLVSEEFGRTRVSGGTKVFKEFGEFWKTLESRGLRSYRNEPSPFGYRGGHKYQCCYDYAFLNVKTKNYLNSCGY